MNTIIKLENAMQARGISLRVERSEPRGWIVYLSSSTRAVAGEADTLDLALSRALLRWDTTDSHDRVAMPYFAPIGQNHHDLPGHAHCGQAHCATCRAPYNAKADPSKWLTCTRYVCPDCLALEQAAASTEKHPIDYFLDLDYPVTVFEAEDADGELCFIAECRDLPGAVAQTTSNTVSGSYQKAKDAARAWIETAFSYGDAVPLPTPMPKD